jgi:hypothetical protein
MRITSEQAKVVSSCTSSFDALVGGNVIVLIALPLHCSRWQDVVGERHVNSHCLKAVQLHAAITLPMSQITYFRFKLPEIRTAASVVVATDAQTAAEAGARVGYHLQVAPSLVAVAVTATLRLGIEEDAQLERST